VPPRLAISILFLRASEKVSWVEALERPQDDLRWKVALGLEREEEPKSTLQEFEARWVIPEKGETLWKKSMAEARRAGSRQSRQMRVALDTTPIWGQGAVKDTSHLLGEGMEPLACRWRRGKERAERAGRSGKD